MYACAEAYGVIFVAHGMLSVISVWGIRQSQRCIENHLLMPERIEMKWFLKVCLAFFEAFHVISWRKPSMCFLGKMIVAFSLSIVFCRLYLFCQMFGFSWFPPKFHSSWSCIISLDISLFAWSDGKCTSLVSIHYLFHVAHLWVCVPYLFT